MNQDLSKQDRLGEITNDLAKRIKQVTSPTVRQTVMAGTLGLATMFGGPNALGQNVETYNTVTHSDERTTGEHVTTIGETFANNYVKGATVGVSTLSQDMTSPNITTTSSIALASETEIYGFSEHNLKTKASDIEFKLTQGIGPHKVTGGFSSNGDVYGGFSANHFQETGVGAYVKRHADKDIDFGGHAYTSLDNGIFVGGRKEDDNLIGVIGKPSSDRLAVRATTIYGVEDNEGFILNQAFITSSSVDTYFGENRNNQIATSNSSVIGGSDAQTMEKTPTRYNTSRPNMFMSDGPTSYIAHTKIGDTHAVEAEAFTDLASLGADNLENTLVGAHASKTIGEPGLDRLGVDLGYNGDDVNAAVSVGSGPDGEPVGKVTFHYNQ